MVDFPISCFSNKPRTMWRCDVMNLHATEARRRTEKSSSANQINSIYWKTTKFNQIDFQQYFRRLQKRRGPSVYICTNIYGTHITHAGNANMFLFIIHEASSHNNYEYCQLPLFKFKFEECLFASTIVLHFAVPNPEPDGCYSASNHPPALPSLSFTIPHS